MPQLGLGVWQASNEEVITAIQKALEVGYRSIDTAAAYKNEEGVGKALKNASVNREELFITTKLWNDDHKRPREALLEVPLQPVNPHSANRPPVVSDAAPDFVKTVTAAMLAGLGDALPVSALPPDGTWPMGTTRCLTLSLRERGPFGAVCTPSL